MRLKATQLMAMLLLLPLCTSCRHDEDSVTGEKEICFSGSSLAPLASRSSGTETLSTEYKMWVAAIYHDQYSENHQYYFGSSIEKQFAWNSSQSAWKGVEDHYYPLSGTMDFLAYAIQNDEHKPTPTYTPATLTASANRFSTLTLDFGNRLDGTDDVVFSDLRNHAPCGLEAVRQNLLFRHALAKIQFETRAEDANTAARFTIYRITIKDVKPSGILEIQPEATTQIIGSDNTATAGSQCTWKELNSQVLNVEAYNSTTGMHPLQSATQGNAVGIPLFLPPQAATDIEIVYTITNDGNTTDYLTRTLSLGTLNWELGKHYTCTLIVGLKQIYIETQTEGAVLDSTPEILDYDELYHGKESI